MSRWYPIATTVEECRTVLADLHGAIDSRARSPSGDKIKSVISHCFDRLQLWCFSFDVDSYALDRKLRQSASLSGMVLDLLDKLKLSLDAAKKEIPRRGSIGDGDLEAARLYLIQFTRVADMLFDLSDALQNPAFTSTGQQSTLREPGYSTLPEPADDAVGDDGQNYPAQGWRTTIAINSSETCRGSRWEEVGALLTHMITFLPYNRRSISFVQLTQGPAVTNKICGLREAIEHVWTHQPTDKLLGAAKFVECLSTASSQLQPEGEATCHSSLIFIVPDGILENDISKIHRSILQKAKRIREANLQMSSLIVSFVVVEPNQYVLRPLFELAFFVNEDRAARGTALVRVVPYYMLSASEETYETMFRRGLADLEEERENAHRLYTESSMTEERAPAHNAEEGSNTIEISPISSYTYQKTISLEFGRLGHIESVVIKEGKQNRRNRPLRPRQGMGRGIHNSGSLTEDLRHRHAIIEYRRQDDAEVACLRMNLTIFDGELVNVRLVQREELEVLLEAEKPVLVSSPALGIRQ